MSRPIVGSIVGPIARGCAPVRCAAMAEERSRRRSWKGLTLVVVTLGASLVAFARYRRHEIARYAQEFDERYR